MQLYGSKIASKAQGYQAEMVEASTYLQEAQTRLAAAKDYSAHSQMCFQYSGVYYQRAMSELSAITGQLTAPPQKQSEQRREQGATS